MTGGYLTLDFSDVEFKGESIVNFVLGYKKGIKKYIQKNKKPIYLILSDSVWNAIGKYLGINYNIRNNSPILIPGIFSNNDYGSGDRSGYYFVINEQYNETGDFSYLSPASLKISFSDDLDRDDYIMIAEV